MIKVIHIIHGLNTGGAETLVKNYMLNLDYSIFDIILLCLEHEDKSPYEKILEKNGIKVIYVDDDLPFKKQSNIITGILRRACNYFAIKRIIQNEKPDIIHSHLSVNSYVKFARPKKETILIYTVHSDPKELWAKKKRDFDAATFLVRNYNMKFIVLHEKMKKDIKRMFSVSNSIVLNNGVDVERIKNAKSSIEVRNDLNIPSDAFVMGHIGRFSKVKNHEFLVDIFKEVAKNNDKAFLLMIGDGPDKEMVINKLNDLNLKGKYLILENRDDIPDLLSTMDVFVFPSLYEGLPLSLIEAQIARKPCFISDKINEHAIISNLVVELPIEQSAAKWCDAIMLYKKPKKIIVDEKNWDIKTVIEKLEQLYINAVSEREDGKK